MAVATLEELTSQVAQVRDNPGIPYEQSKDMSLDELRATMSATRSALTAAIDSASDSAFDEQPPNADGEEVWSIGQIVGHCNGALLGIGGDALSIIGVDAGDPPETLVAVSEPAIMSRDEAMAAAEAVAIDDFFALIPDDPNLDNTKDHDFFGPVSGRSWLYFMAMHEADHVAQIKSLG